MATTKNPNSILFLTTLGVYLGLVLVGAAPQVAAHQRGTMTRLFDIHDEIEFRDELDNDPDESAKAGSHGTVGSKFAQFALAYSKFVIDDYKSEIRLREELERICPDACRLSYLYYSPTFSPDLERILGVSRYSGEFVYAGKDLVRQMEIKYSPSRSEMLKFQAAFFAVPENLKDRWSPTATLVRTNSKITKNPQSRHLVVVTRLPRGSLETLLATDAK